MRVDFTSRILRPVALVLFLSSRIGFAEPGNLPGGAQKNSQILIDRESMGTDRVTESFTITRSFLNFAGIAGGASPEPQTISINSWSQSSVWTIQKNADWISVIPAQGTGTGYFSVFVDPAGLNYGAYHGTLSLTDAEGNSQSVAIHLHVYNGGSTMYPFGAFDTPVNGSTVSGSVAVTGWALDDVGVASVKIYRTTEQGDVFIGDAVFIEGARPDIEQQYSQMQVPNDFKSGWGYMMLTNFLPNGGNGTFSIYAKVTDMEGNQSTLGPKTIYCDNAHAVKPFGAIDTPAQGGKASGSNYVNWGWALTPAPNEIPRDGSTLQVYVDGVNLGSPQYNVYRQDIASLFPDYLNSSGAAGCYSLNTRGYENGVHTISWLATDNAGNSDGIGSRYFTIQNTNDPAPETDCSTLYFGSGTGSLKKSNAMNGGSPYTQVFHVWNSGAKTLNWQVSADQDWISLDPASGTDEGWVYATVDPTALPAGLYQGKITISEAENANPPEFIKVELAVTDDSQSPIGGFDYPDSGRVVSGNIVLSGWALDEIGVESVKIYRPGTEGNIDIGEAHFAEGARPDVAIFYSNYPNSARAGWSLNFSTNTLEDGEYIFFAEVTNFEGQKTLLEGKVFRVGNASAVLPFGSLDTPSEGGIAAGDDYLVTGWALTPQPNAIPTDGSTISVIVDGITMGQATYNVPREDISSQFPGYQNGAGPGGSFILNTTRYSDGAHTLCWSVADDAGNTNERLGIRHFMIQNHSEASDVKNDETLPSQTDLLPGYPNPFNPTTNIRYHLAKDARVSLFVFDILGRRVSILMDNTFKTAGSYTASWDGTNGYGHVSASGVYLLVMKTEQFVKSHKLILLK